MHDLTSLGAGLGGAGLGLAVGFMRFKALSLLDHAKPRSPRRETYTRWLFWTYERRDLTSNGDGTAAPGYFGVIPVDVIAATYAEAYEKARTKRPPTTDEFGYELKSIAEHPFG